MTSTTEIREFYTLSLLATETFLRQQSASGVLQAGLQETAGLLHADMALLYLKSAEGYCLAASYGLDEVPSVHRRQEPTAEELATLSMGLWLQWKLPEEYTGPAEYNYHRMGAEQAIALGLRAGPELVGYTTFLFRSWADRNELVSALSALGATWGLQYERLRELERRTAAEEALRGSEARLRAIFESEPECVKVVATDGRLLEMNPAGLRMLEVASAAEVLHQPISRFVHPQDRAAFARLHRCVSQGQTGELRFRLVGLEGTTRWVETHAVPLRDASGAVTSVLSVTRDVTERQRAEESLRHSQWLTQATLNALTAHIAVLDGNGTIVAVNRPWLEFARANGGALERTGLGVNYLAVCEAAHAAGDGLALKMLQGIQAVMRAELETFSLEYPCPAPGVPRWFLARVTRFDEGGPLRVVVAHEDITARKLAEESLRLRLAELEALNRISTALRSAQTSEQMLPLLLDETLAALGCEVGAIFLYEPLADGLRVAFGHGWYATTRAVLRVGEGLPGKVFAEGIPYVSRDLACDPLLPAEVAARVPPGWGGAFIPIRAAARSIGVLAVAVRLPGEVTAQQLKLLTSVSEMAGIALHRLQLHEQTTRRLEHLQALRAVDRAIITGPDLPGVLTVLLEQAAAQLRMDAAGVLLLEPGGLTLRPAASLGFRTQAYLRSRPRLGEEGVGQVALTRRPLLASEAEAEASLAARGLEPEGFGAYAALPLVAKGGLKGVLEVFRQGPLPAEAEWLSFLEMLADQAAIAVDNFQLFDGLQRSNAELALAYDATIEGWSRALDLRDKETEGHTQRVTELTLRLARAAGMSEEELVHVRRGALLHDIGKMGVPDAILLKPAPLSAEEWAVMRKHPSYAYEMLYPIAYLRPALDIPYCHHEKWDGSGYPRGLKGQEIPLAARLFAVADVYDALTSDRPYRPAWSQEKALCYILEHAGSHFDPAAAHAFIRMLQGEP